MCLLALCTLILACNGGGGDSDDTNSNDSGMPQTPVLGPTHPGYQHPACGDCHDLPREYHSQTQPFECAGCHGGNGACDPLTSGTDHQRSGDCLSCHGENHAVTANQECVSCHFAYTGLVDCSTP